MIREQSGTSDDGVGCHEAADGQWQPYRKSILA
jgi:hypothetical protein